MFFIFTNSVSLYPMDGKRKSWHVGGIPEVDYKYLVGFSWLGVSTDSENY